MVLQTTLDDKVSLEGILPLRNKPSKMIIHPAPPNTGKVFLYKGQSVPVHYDYARKDKSVNWVRLEKDGVIIEYPEHILATLAGLNIDNAIIELEDPFCPTPPSGGVREFVEALEPRIRPQSQLREYWMYAGKGLHSSVHENNDSVITVSHSQGFKINYQAYFPHKPIGDQFHSYIDNRFNFKDVMDARSIVFSEQFEIMPENHGVSDTNFLIVGEEDEKNYLNSGTSNLVRYGGEEFVRHKILDLLGDLSLAGKPFYNTEFCAHMTGHEFHIDTLKEMFKQGLFVRYTPK